MTEVAFDARAALARIRARKSSEGADANLLVAKSAKVAKVGSKFSKFSDFSDGSASVLGSVDDLEAECGHDALCRESRNPPKRVKDEGASSSPPATSATPATQPPVCRESRNSASLVPDMFDDFDEAAAIAQQDGGLTRDQAEDQAAHDQGFANATAFRSALIAQWLQQVNEWGADHAGDPFRQRLLYDARAFCGSEWAIQALQLGWAELDIFAVHGDAPEERFDGRGLVASLDRREIAVMASDTASIRCPAGHCVTYYRRPFDRQRGAVLLWEVRS